MKKTIYYSSGIIPVILAAIMVFALAACGEKQGAGGPQKGWGTPEVGIIEIKTEKVSLSTELSGRTSPYLVAEVRPQVNGIILKRLFTEGTEVKEGQSLYQIDPAVYQAAVDNEKAALARAEANLLPAKLKEERFRGLVEIKAVSQQEYDDSLATLKKSEADVISAKAALDAALINLTYTSVKAPISGRIGRSSVTAGALVTAGQAAAMATIQQMDPIYVDVTQSSSELLRLRRDLAEGRIKENASGKTSVGLKFEDGTIYPLEGALKFSEVTVSQETGSVMLRALFPNPDQSLLPGMFVRALIQEGIVEDAILVSQRGVTRNPKGDALVMLVSAEEKVEPKLIKVSRTVGDSWLVTEGLKPGDRVILEGIQRARPGTPVKAVPFGSPPSAPAPQAGPGKAKGSGK